MYDREKRDFCFSNLKRRQKSDSGDRSKVPVLLDEFPPVSDPQVVSGVGVGETVSSTG